jgi:hypothetical protein
MSQPPLNGSHAARASIDPRRFVGTNINPVTGLATDFLNHFNEAIMLLEMLPMAPDCKDDFLAWRPASYQEHFIKSSFKDRELAIAAYEAAHPAVRGMLDEIADCMNVMLGATQQAMRRGLSEQTIAILAVETARGLKSLAARAGAAINGELIRAVETDEPAEAAPQAAVDALFGR